MQLTCAGVSAAPALRMALRCAGMMPTSFSSSGLRRGELVAEQLYQIRLVDFRLVAQERLGIERLGLCPSEKTAKGVCICHTCWVFLKESSRLKPGIE